MLFITFLLSFVVALSDIFSTFYGWKNTYQSSIDFPNLLLQLGICTIIAIISLLILSRICKYTNEEIAETIYELVTLKDESQFTGKTSGSIFYVATSFDTEEVYTFYYQLEDGGYKRKKIFSKNVTIYEKEEMPRVIETTVYTKSKLPNWLWDILTFGWLATKEKVSYEIIVPKDTIFRSISLNNQ